MASSLANLANKLIFSLGIALIVLALYIFVRLFQDPLTHEFNYVINSYQGVSPLNPPNTEFAITIDKIGASSSIVSQVDPYDSAIYQLALRDGVAHAKGTKLPGEGGNIFLFAHSSADLLTAERYNSVFYLTHHLESGDKIKIWSQGVEYLYQVAEKKYVNPSDIAYLVESSSTEQLTLMTCWPPGTTLKRLIILAEPI